MDLIKELTKSQLKEMPAVEVGDTVKVHVKVKEGARERIQVFEGTVIAKKHGGIEETITVRRMSYGVGVEKVFPLHSPTIDKIEVVRNGAVRRLPYRKRKKSSYGGFSARNDFVDKMSIKRHLIFYFSGVKPYFCTLHKVYMDVT